jgi:hypothetical protein
MELRCHRLLLIREGDDKEALASNEVSPSASGAIGRLWEYSATVR